jgi:FlaA1/EpsC-like NDP-sugar epimerase
MVEREEAGRRWEGRRVLITGVCGTVGRELLRQVVRLGAEEVVGLDNGESGIFLLAQEYLAKPQVRLYVGDIRDRDSLIRRMHGMDIVLHAAALKHVILGEESPRDVIQTNVLGTQNVIDAALDNGVKRVLHTSSDKAVNPTNVMGTSKLMSERLMTAANAVRRSDGPIFASTRFGNVLGSSGSVVPVFARQISNGGPVTLTDPKMTRFVMTLEEAVRLVMDSVFLACGGEVFVTKMPVARIADLAEVMVEELSPHYGLKPSEVQIKTIGVKAGEKLHEELLNEEETRRTIELDRYFVVLPAFGPVHGDGYPTADDRTDNVGVSLPYRSSAERPMDREELRDYLVKHRLMEGG